MNIDRRTMLFGLAALAAPLPRLASAQDDVLPLRTPGIDHLDVMVPDVEATTKFYMGLLNTELHAQEFRGGYRYFVLLRPLTESREVGYLAVGDSSGRGSYIGHFCTSVYDWRRDGEAIMSALGERFAAEGFGEFPGSRGFGALFSDPDGIEIQFLPSPDTLVTAAVPSDLVPAQQGLVTPQRVDHVVLHVSNLQRAVDYYRILYGRENSREGNRATFTFTNGSRLVLEGTSYVYGSAQTRIARYGIRVAPFDRAKVTGGIAQLGGTVVNDAPGALRLRDVDGIELELVS